MTWNRAASIARELRRVNAACCAGAVILLLACVGLAVMIGMVKP